MKFITDNKLTAVDGLWPSAVTTNWTTQELSKSLTCALDTELKKSFQLLRITLVPGFQSKMVIT